MPQKARSNGQPSTPRGDFPWFDRHYLQRRLSLVFY